MMSQNELDYNHPTSPDVLLWHDGPQIFFARDIIKDRRHLVIALEEYNTYAALMIADKISRDMIMDRTGQSVNSDKLKEIFKGREVLIISWVDETRTWEQGEIRVLDESEIHGSEDVASLH